METVYKVELTTRRGTPVIGLGGECDLTVVPAIKGAVTKALASGAPTLVFDLEEATFLDSAALGALLGARRRVVEAGGTVTLLCSNQRVLRLLKLLELHQLFDVKSRQEWEQE